MLEKSPLAERAIQYRSHNDTDTTRNEKTLIYYQMNYHNATFPAIPKSMVAVTTPRALNTLRIVGIVML